MDRKLKIIPKPKSGTRTVLLEKCYHSLKV